MPNHEGYFIWLVAADHRFSSVSGLAPIMDRDSDDQPSDRAADADEEELLSVSHDSFCISKACAISSITKPLKIPTASELGECDP